MRSDERRENVSPILLLKAARHALLEPPADPVDLDSQGVVGDSQPLGELVAGADALQVRVEVEEQPALAGGEDVQAAEETGKAGIRRVRVRRTGYTSSLGSSPDDCTSLRLRRSSR